jgi:hypothetical protein
LTSWFPAVPYRTIDVPAKATFSFTSVSRVYCLPEGLAQYKRELLRTWQPVAELHHDDETPLVRTIDEKG